MVSNKKDGRAKSVQDSTKLSKSSLQSFCCCLILRAKKNKLTLMEAFLFK